MRGCYEHAGRGEVWCGDLRDWCWRMQGYDEHAVRVRKQWCECLICELAESVLRTSTGQTVMAY